MRLYQIDDNKVMLATGTRLYVVEDNKVLGHITCIPMYEPPTCFTKTISVVQQFIFEEININGLTIPQIYELVKEQVTELGSY